MPDHEDIYAADDAHFKVNGATMATVPSEAEFARRALLESGESAADELEDALRLKVYEMRKWHESAFCVIRNMLGSAGASADVMRVFDSIACRMEFFTVCNATVPADVARNYGKSRETINKTIQKFEQLMNLPPLPTQRDAEAKANITAGRNSHKKTAKV